MKRILVLIGGGERDQIVLQTALAAALPLSAHLDCMHVHVSPSPAARQNRADFVIGKEVHDMLNELEKRADTFSDIAARNFREFCANGNVEMCEMPAGTGNVTAAFRKERNCTLERLTSFARQSDLVVMGRLRQTQGLPENTLERLILDCGRPVLVAASSAPRELTGTVMVCWKEAANYARAVAAATPILAHARRVVFVTIKERGEDEATAVNDLVQGFATHGCVIEKRVLASDERKIPAQLAAAAADCSADLVVMGAYERSRARELLFGSATEAFLANADRPVLLMH